MPPGSGPMAAFYSGSWGPNMLGSESFSGYGGSPPGSGIQAKGSGKSKPSQSQSQSQSQSPWRSRSTKWSGISSRKKERPNPLRKRSMILNRLIDSLKKNSRRKKGLLKNKSRKSKKL